MAGWSASIPPAVAALSARNGRYDERTPKMRPSDMVAIFGLFSQGIPRAIDRVANGCFNSSVVSPEGLVLLPTATDIIASAAYVFRSLPRDGGPAWRRTPTAGGMANALGATYEPARLPRLVRSDEPALLMQLRELVNHYQEGLNAITQAIVLYPANQIASSDLCRLLMRSIRMVAADLEVLAENPPSSLSSDLRGAIGTALEASEEAAKDLADAGARAAAHAANLAGELAANAAGGFFDAANLTTIGAALIVGYVALKGYV